MSVSGLHIKILPTDLKFQKALRKSFKEFREVEEGPRQNQIGIRDCSLLQSSGNRLGDEDFHAIGVIPARE